MMNRKFFILVATFFNIGKIPKAPGTFGTLAAIPLWYAMTHVSTIFYMVVTIAIVLLGIIASQVYEAEFQKHDSKEIVIDEVAGFLITMVMVPPSWIYLVIGFVLFRLLDILKPWPMSHLDKNVKGGVGVMVDDIAAGIISSLLLQLLIGSGVLSRLPFA